MFIDSPEFITFVDQYAGVTMSDIIIVYLFAPDLNLYDFEWWLEFEDAFNNFSFHSRNNLYNNEAILNEFLKDIGNKLAEPLGGVTMVFYYGIVYPVDYPEEPSQAWQDQNNAYWAEYYQVMDTWAENNGYVTWSMVYNRPYELWQEMEDSGYIDSWIAANTRPGGIIQIYSKWAMKIEGGRLYFGNYYQPSENIEIGRAHV